MGAGWEALPGLNGVPMTTCLLAGGVLVLLALWRPLTALLRLAGRTGAGLAFLALFAPVGKLLGIPLGVNLLNALVLGLLGAPGFGLLMLLGTVV